MLVISRKVGEKIIVSDDIEITLVQSRNGKARIGIDAPTLIPIQRQEIYQKITGKADEIEGEAA